jgi:dipeptidyl aminopeptidase/acylaminoacyl peptidase
MRCRRQVTRCAEGLARTLSQAAAPWLVSTVLLASSADAAAHAEKLLTVDDLLRLSEVGRAAVQPGGNTFVWEQSPPYDTLTDYGVGTTGTWQGCDYEILTTGPDSGAPRPLFHAPPGTTFQLGDFSRDGRFLALSALRSGKVRLAIYDFRRHRLTEYPVAPTFSPTQPDPDWVWLDDRHLAVAAYPAGAAGPWPLAFRRAIGAHLVQSWVRSWAGKEASVDRYESSAGDEERPLPGRLLVVDVVSGQIRQLALGRYAALRPSADGRWLAAVRESMLPQAAPERPHLDWTYARSTLTLFSLSGNGEPKTVAPGLEVLSNSLQWSPSGGKLGFFAWPVGTELGSGDFQTLDPQTGEVKLIPHPGLALASQRARAGPQWPERLVWVGDSIAVFARATPGEAGSFTHEDIETGGIVDPRVAVAATPAHWFLLTNAVPRDLTPGMQNVSPIPVIATESQLVIVGDGAAWQMNASGSPVPLFRGAPRLLDVLAYRNFFRQPRANDGQRFFSVADAPNMLARIDLERGTPVLRQWRTVPDSSVLALSEFGTIFSEIGAGKGARLALIGPGRASRMLGEINPVLDGIAETRWIDFPYKDRQDSMRPELSGCLLLPPNYETGHRYPLIVEIYPDRPGGCGAPERRYRYAMGAGPESYSEHLLAAKGFVVLRPDTGGGISRSADGPQAALSAVVDQGVDAAIAAGYADPGRVGLMGFSQGGFASLWVATQSPRYKAVVSLNGWADLMLDFFEMNWWQELVPDESPALGDFERYLTAAGSSFSMGGTPWQMPERYIANSPLWRSDQVSAPVLLIHSDFDEFDDAGYKAFFTSLYFQKKPARLLIYRGEGHSPSSPANIKDMWKNIFEWFDRYMRVERDNRGEMILRGP